MKLLLRYLLFCFVWSSAMWLNYWNCWLRGLSQRCQETYGPFCLSRWFFSGLWSGLLATLRWRVVTHAFCNQTAVVFITYSPHSLVLLASFLKWLRSNKTSFCLFWHKASGSKGGLNWPCNLCILLCLWTFVCGFGLALVWFWLLLLFLEILHKNLIFLRKLFPMLLLIC